jgi:hypothetical protein
MRRPGVQLFESIDAFYDDAGPYLRRLAPEVDFGYFWTDPALPGENPRGLPHWRVSWIEGTGEVYAVRDFGGPVRLYGVVPGGRHAVEAFLDGWVDHCGPGGLAWLEQRFRS